MKEYIVLQLQLQIAVGQDYFPASICSCNKNNSCIPGWQLQLMHSRLAIAAATTQTGLCNLLPSQPVLQLQLQTHGWPGTTSWLLQLQPSWPGNQSGWSLSSCNKFSTSGSLRCEKLASLWNNTSPCCRIVAILFCRSSGRKEQVPKEQSNVH